MKIPASALFLFAIFSLAGTSVAQTKIAPASSTTSFRLLDAETGASIGKAQVVFLDAWQLIGGEKRRPSISLQSDPAQAMTGPEGKHAPNQVVAASDEDGHFQCVPPKVDATLTVLHEKHGVVHLKEDEWSRQGGDLRIRLQPWASIAGMVTRHGKPAPGVIVSISRTMTHASIGNMFGFYSPPLTHGVMVRTDAEGRFVVDRLLPTQIDGREVPYMLYESVISGEPPTDEALKTVRGNWFGTPMSECINISRGSATLEPGAKQHRDFEITPRCKRGVSGRLIWADGSTVRPVDIPPRGGKDGIIAFSLKLNSGWNGTMPMTRIGDDGRFKVTIPIAGRWQIKAEGLHAIGKDSDFEFQLPAPSDESGSSAPVDLGDIVFHRPGQSKEVAAPVADADGNAEVTFTIVDESQNPVTGARVKATSLESNQKTGSRYHYPKNLPETKSGQGGIARLKLPVHYRDGEGKDWTITDTSVEITHEGFEPLKRRLALGEKGAVLALSSSHTVALRVTKEGKAMPHDSVQYMVGWSRHGFDCFEHAKWKEDERLILRRKDVPPGRWQVQVGHIDSTRWRWFSQIEETDTAKRDEITTLVLKRGTEVSGRIDDTVPRPIKRGMVRVMVRMPPPSSAESYPVYWSDWQETDESGSFSFRGLPAGDAWIAAACDGWISEQAKSPTPKLTGDRNWAEPLYLTWSAQPFHVDDQPTTVNVRMIRAGTVLFHFKDADGEPIVGARTNWDPKIDFGPDRQNLFSTNRALDHMLIEVDESSHRSSNFLPRVEGKTDAHGSLRIENLPPGRVRLAISIDNRYYHCLGAETPKSDHPHDIHAPFQMDVKPGEVLEKTFTAEQKAHR